MTAHGSQAQWDFLAKLGAWRHLCKPCTEFFESLVGSWGQMPSRDSAVIFKYGRCSHDSENDY